jgi:hypothetical protein
MFSAFGLALAEEVEDSEGARQGRDGVSAMRGRIDGEREGEEG